jgi:IS5 family transposase
MTFIRYDLETLVRPDHVLRKINQLISFRNIAIAYKDLETGIRCIYLQFHYDLSDRELEERLQDDLAYRWFCGFSLTDQTPDHTYFCRMRALLGTQRLATMFRKIIQQCREKKIVRSVFTFVDSSTIVTKVTTWDERDRALRHGEEALNNQNINKYSADKDARFGCKGKHKFWYGYKRHVSLDMGSGLITRVAATPANVPDHAALRHVCPRVGMVFGDKGYCPKLAQETMRKRGCHSGVILKNNMKEKNRDKDRWLTKARMPFEGVFSKKAKRARYRGLVKVQFQVFMEAIVHNVKRLLVLDVSPLEQVT